MCGGCNDISRFESQTRGNAVLSRARVGCVFSGAAIYYLRRHEDHTWRADTAIYVAQYSGLLDWGVIYPASRAAKIDLLAGHGDAGGSLVSGTNVLAAIRGND